MRRFMWVIGAILITAGAVGMASAETEQDIINRYLKKTEKKHTKKIGWAAANFTINRVNRQNDYNTFANYVSGQVANGELPWIRQAGSFGIDFGLGVRKDLVWTIGGEYWLKMGTDEAGPFSYTPPSGTPVTIENLTSEVQVYGVTTGLQYFVYHPPTPEDGLTKLAVRVNGNVGYYKATWDLWPEYENLNLSTSTSTGTNTTFEGTAPGFQLGFGIDYPFNFYGFALGADFSYMYLNFDQIAWYNSQDEEVIVTYTGTPDGRVDLDLSGFRGKIEVKRYFSF
jgi:hypothetical protein